MSGKSDKTQTHKKKEERKSGESRKYAHISQESITITAESCGVFPLGEDVAKQLAEDVSYRLREVIHNCSVRLRHSKRKILTTADLNAVLKIADIPPIYGHGSDKSLPLEYVKDAEVFGVKEEEIDLVEIACKDVDIVQTREPSVKVCYMYPDLPAEPSVHHPKTEEARTATSGAAASSSSAVAATTPTSATSSSVTAASGSSSTNAATPSTTATAPEKPNSPKIPDILLAYYKEIANTILGNSNAGVQVVLNDLKTNSKIQLIIPYLLNFLALSLQKLPRGLKFAPYRLRCFNTAQALSWNIYIDPSATMAVTRLISTLVLCTLDPTLIEGSALSCNYDLRDNAAQVLARVVCVWCDKDTKLHLDILQKLGSVLLDGSSSLRSHYGALQVLNALGIEALEYCLWPHLKQYLHFLDALTSKLHIKPKSKTKMLKYQQLSDLKAIEGAIMSAAEQLYRQKWEHFHFPELQQLTTGIKSLEPLLDSYFGDRLCARRPYYGPLPTKRREGLNLSSGSGMETDFRIPSSMQDSNKSDFELDYRNWTAIAKIPTHVSSLLGNENASVIAALLQRRSKVSACVEITSIFEVPVKRKHCLNVINFNFAGAKPVPVQMLKRHRLDQRHAQFSHHSNYYSKCNQLTCINKLAKRQTKSMATSSWYPDFLGIV